MKYVPTEARNVFTKNSKMAQKNFQVQMGVAYISRIGIVKGTHCANIVLLHLTVHEFLAKT